jgi:YVTN family beta-propeller protein
VNTDTGARVDTVIADGSGIDHIVLSPDGAEIWATASESGAVVVLDAATRKNLARIPMPGFGDPHGVVFVAYGADGVGRVVADQGDFHGGVDPRNGKPLGE